MNGRLLPPAEVATHLRVHLLDDGRRCRLRYGLVAFASPAATFYAVTALVVREGPGGGGELDFAISPALACAEDEARELFERLARAEAPVFPVHLADIVRDLLLAGRAAARRRRLAV